ncbi:MAG: RNA pseudouridine synthase, partial [Bacteroidales bacterium]|nr:RNA pseudouridine synthase [Bacteroidales bacterium]
MQNKKDNKPKDLVFKVLDNDELLPFIMKKMNGISRTKAKNILAGSVSVDGQQVSKHNFQLTPGMEVKIGRNQGGEPL